MRFLTWLIAIPVALIIIAVSISNSTPAIIDLSPLPFIINVPIWAIAVGAVLFGIIVGGSIKWMLDHRRRVVSISRARKLQSAQKQINLLQKKIEILEKSKSGTGKLFTKDTSSNISQ